MDPLTDPELKERRNKLQSADSSFALTESIGELLVDIAGQTSGQSAELTTITEALSDPRGGIGSFSAGIGGVKTSLEGMKEVAADARDKLRLIATELGETKDLVRAACGHLNSLALRGTEHHPSHVHLDGAPHRMIVELQAATFEGLAQLLQDLRSTMVEWSTTIVRSVEEHSRQSTSILTTISHNEQRLAALEQRTAPHESDAGGAAPPRRSR